LLYDLPAAQNALTKIAARMSLEGTRDLQWWRIPTWAPSAPRRIAGGLVVWLAVVLVFALPAFLWGGLATRLVFGLVFGLVPGLLIGFLSRGGYPPRRIGKLRLRKALSKKNLVRALAAGIGTGLVFGLAFGRWPGPLPRTEVVLVFGTGTGPPAGLAVMLADALAADPDSTPPLSPDTSWRNDRKYGLAAGLTAGLGIGLAIVLSSVLEAGFFFSTLGLGLSTWLSVGLRLGLVAGLRRGLAAGLVTGFEAALAVGLAASRAWPVSLASAQIATRWHTPVHLMKFLDDARDRNVLRTAGPAYQFRHARLQDRLAAINTAELASVTSSQKPEETPDSSLAD